MKTGIVFEGGAFRTIFSCGVMDAFLKYDIMPDYMIGVSAGAAYGVSYASRQSGRNLDILIKYRNDRRYLSMYNLIDKENKSVYGLKFGYETIANELEPFDYDTFDKYEGEFYCVVTNVITGKPEYMRYTGKDRTNTVLKASCALPVLFPYIYINDTPYLDGGLSDSIPYEKAFADGCDRLVVVLTREAGYIKKTSPTTRAMARAFYKYPELSRDILKRAERYNRSLKNLEQLEKEGRVIIIRPTCSKGFSRTEKDRIKILSMYNDGYNQGAALASTVRTFYKLPPRIKR
ncbi:MAG: patatin family protein [Eubacteriales bacterium]|nr:patatin family protein [Eubacteriales bacterium]